MNRSSAWDEESEPCSYAEALAALLALVGSEVELTVTAKARSSRQLLAARGPLDAGPELGTDEDSLIPLSMGDAEIALKRAWLKGAWRSGSGSHLALLFEGGVLVEIERAPEPEPG